LNQEVKVLIKFQSEESGEFVMFSEVAIQLLKLMGMSGSPEGAVDADGARDALSSLEAALGRIPTSPDSPDELSGEESNTGLATRAVPLLDMLRQAKATQSYVMWRPE